MEVSNPNQPIESPQQLSRSQIFYQKHRNTILDVQKRYYQRNVEAKREYQRQYRLAKKKEMLNLNE